MTYELVELPEQTVAGITKKIVIQSPPMALWGEFYEHAISMIEGSVDTKAYGLYYDFDEGCTSMVAAEVHQLQRKNGSIVDYTIPAGTYAKFCIRGEVHHVVPLFWQKLPDLKLDRSYQCDFEVFPSSATEDVEIEIYVSVR